MVAAHRKSDGWEISQKKTIKHSDRSRPLSGG